jgi:hypothetical protein
VDPPLGRHTTHGRALRRRFDVVLTHRASTLSLAHPEHVASSAQVPSEGSGLSAGPGALPT